MPVVVDRYGKRLGRRHRVPDVDEPAVVARLAAERRDRAVDRLGQAVAVEVEELLRVAQIGHRQIEVGDAERIRPVRVPPGVRFGLRHLGDRVVERADHQLHPFVLERAQLRVLERAAQAHVRRSPVLR